MRARGLIAASLVVLALAAAPDAGAAPRVFTVDDTADLGLSEHPELCGQAKGPLEHDCTLRAALEAARTFDGVPSGAESVAIVLGEGHYTLSTGHALPVGDVLPEACRGPGATKVSCPLTIQGGPAEKTIVDGAGSTGLLRIQKGAGPITIDSLTLARSLSAGGAVEDDEGPPLAIRSSRLLENSGEGSSGGAAVQLHRATMTIADSVLEGNRAQTDGAVQASGGELSLVRSSVTGNAAPLGAGAVGAREGAHVALLETTVAANSAGGAGALAAGTGATLGLRWSTVDGGSAPALTAAGSQEITTEGSILTGTGALACAGPVPVAVSGPNVLHGGVSACALSGPAPSTADPLLGAPAASGRVTVMPLLRGSPALNAGGASCPGSVSEGLPVDGRGVTRPQGPGCDLGAFESAADALVSMTANPVPVVAGAALTVRAVVRAASADGLSGVTVTFPLPPLANLSAAPSACVDTYGPAPQLTCSLGAIESGGSRIVTVQLRPLVPETLQLGARVQIAQADPVPGDDSATVAVPVGSATPTRPVAILLSRTLRVDRHGNARVRLRCLAAGAGTPCATSLALYSLHGPLVAAQAPAARRLALLRTTFGAGRTVTVGIHLSKQARRAIHLRRSARARLVLATGIAPVRSSVQVVRLLSTR